MKKRHPIKLLFIATFPPPPGGQRLIFQYLFQDLSERFTAELHLTRVDLSVKRFGRLGLFILPFRVLRGVLLIPFHNAVTLQAPHNYIYAFGPVFYWGTRLFGKKLITRRSAGRNIELFEQAPAWLQWLLKKTVLNADLSFFETHYEVAYFARLSSGKVRFLSNNRPMVNTQWQPLSRAIQHFVFLGDLCQRKGVQHLLAVFQKLATQGKPYRLTLIGEPKIDLPPSLPPNVTLMGKIPHNQVYQVLKQHDVLILPSYTEGIPGAIIEAFMMDKPVIATAIPSIREFIEPGKNGLLIEPGNERELLQAIETIASDVERYNAMSRYIHETKERFSTTFWTDKFVEYVKEVIQ